MQDFDTPALPQDFCDRIRASHADHDEFLKAINSEPFLSVRLNRRKWSDGLLPLGTSVPWCADGFYLDGRPSFTLLPAFHAGAFYVQEASSMSYSVAINQIKDALPQSPACLDLCAAPGGKATLILSMLGERGIVVANEVVRQRSWILRENIAKWGVPSAIVTNRTPAEITSGGALFDLISVDAPCSGEGMFRKDATARTEWTARAAADCAKRQREILSDIWPALRRGGYMIYSTCTFNPEENERNMEWAVAELGAEAVPLSMPQGQGITAVPFDGGEGYSFLPHKVRGEGFFICLLHKASDDAAPLPAGKSRKARQQRDGLKETGIGKELVTGCKLFLSGSDVCAFPADRAARMAELTTALSPIMSGVPVCGVIKKKGQDVVSPAPELPLSLAFAQGSLPRVDVDARTVLKFLHGDADLALPPGADGWCALYHQGLPLGLVKRIGLRLNNYWPKEWRIRMAVK
ncbi:MAG: RNA methyltransferase [Marinilabiliaceae bacterium]